MAPKKLLTLTVLAGLLCSATPCPAAEKLQSQTLQQIARQTMKFHFLYHEERTLGDFIASLPVQARYRRRGGVFVTLSKNGKTRACWGSVFPEHDNLVESTAYATIAALTKDYRFPPVRPGEIKHLKAQVTVVGNLSPVSDIKTVNPLKHGLMIRSGGKSAVILPGEAADAHYQLVQSRLKAGIKRDEAYQLFRIEAEVYE